MSGDLDVEHYAKKILNQVRNLPENYNLPLPVRRLRALCNALLDRPEKAGTLPPMTQVETNVLQSIKQDIMQGIPPTSRSVAERMGYKTHTSAADVIRRLVNLGYVKREGSKKQIVVVKRED